MQGVLLLISLVLPICVFAITPTRAEVVTLTEDTFSDMVKEKDIACKNLGSLWEDLGSAMEGEDEIEVGHLDCSTSKPVCAKVDIHSYPTFKLFYHGEEVSKCLGPRDVESLKVFVLEEAEKAAAKAQLGSDINL